MNPVRPEIRCGFPPPKVPRGAPGAPRDDAMEQV